MTANSICSRKGTDGIKEVLIKSGAHIAPSDFFVSLYESDAGILAYFKEFSCKMTENLQARCVPSR